MDTRTYKVEDRLSSQLQNTEMIQFPQPTRPINSYNFETPEFPLEPYYINNMDSESSFPGENFLPQDYENHQPKISAEGENENENENENEKEILEQVLELIAELYDRLPSSIRSQVNLDMLKGRRDRLKGLKVHSTITRGGNIGSLEEIKQKLERFKIRTVQQGTVVQDEEEGK